MKPIEYYQEFDTSTNKFEEGSLIFYENNLWCDQTIENISRNLKNQYGKE